MCLDRGAVDTALRALPSHGFTAGLFGQRDRALLVLAQIIGLPYQSIADLTADNLRHDPSTGTVTITATGRTPVVVDTGEDVVVCAGCALTRWLRTHAVLTQHIATQPLIDHLRAVEPVTETELHDCREPVPATAGEVALLSPVNQWGHLPFPITRLSPHAVSRQARDLLIGQLRIHRDRGTPASAVEAPAAPTAAKDDTPPQLWPYGAAQREAAWNQRRHDLQQLADVAADLEDVERRAAELAHRVDRLLAELG